MIEACDHYPQIRMIRCVGHAPQFLAGYHGSTKPHSQLRILYYVEVCGPCAVPVPSLSSFFWCPTQSAGLRFHIVFVGPSWPSGALTAGLSEPRSRSLPSTILRECKAVACVFARNRPYASFASSLHFSGCGLLAPPAIGRCCPSDVVYQTSSPVCSVLPGI